MKQRTRPCFRGRIKNKRSKRSIKYPVLCANRLLAMQELAENQEDFYLDSEWASTKSLKQHLNGTAKIRI